MAIPTEAEEGGKVVTADRGHAFAFTTRLRGRDSTRWRYRFEPAEGGTRVTESYEYLWSTPLIRLSDALTPRKTMLKRGMRRALRHSRTVSQERRRRDRLLQESAHLVGESPLDLGGQAPAPRPSPPRSRGRRGKHLTATVTDGFIVVDHENPGHGPPPAPVRMMPESNRLGKGNAARERLGDRIARRPRSGCGGRKAGLPVSHIELPPLALLVAEAVARGVFGDGEGGPLLYSNWRTRLWLPACAARQCLGHSDVRMAPGYTHG